MAKIIDAVWEQRNLGMRVQELEAERTDSPEALREALGCLDSPYCVVKLPENMPALSLIVQEYGFRYAETMFTMEKRLRTEPELPGIWQRYAPQIGVHTPDEAEIGDILMRVRSGAVFQTDRIALDPHFSPQIAGIRYANWISDLLREGGCRVHIVTVKDQPVAFDILRSAGNGVQDDLLGGLLDQESARGMGFTVPYAAEQYTLEAGDRALLVKVSSNNLPMLRLRSLFGYSIRECVSVFVRHAE